MAVVVFSAGCSKYVELEDHQISLVLGLDTDERGNKWVYSASPTFDKQSPKKYNVHSAKANTLQQARDVFNNQNTGAHSIGKIQIILLGKKFLQQKKVFSFMDALFRDPKNEINAQMIAVDGDVKEIMHFHPSEKGQLGQVLRNIIENAFRNRTSVNTNLQKFHHQFSDHVTAPFLPEIRIDKNKITVSGTALLDKKGKYVLHLNTRETAVLLLLLREASKPIPFTLHISSKTTDKRHFVSFRVTREKVKVKAAYVEDHFVFAISMKLEADITEHSFPIEAEKIETEIKASIEEELSRQCQELLLKFRKNGSDPIGLGNYARIKQYKQWKLEKDNWEQSLSKAKTSVAIKLKINSLGVSE